LGAAAAAQSLSTFRSALISFLLQSEGIFR
jgi:hypothetical protein